ncbi:MAG: Dipeptide transport system permease protein DppC [uncultured Acidimicrobiales bacterium]|uniref:Dipeptide transport system permease protein DppC n=1 Tax=uncultured Acidimicrobiales bacterium TaxID=310071 RepID=A0A6J4IG95_9ACTN|nr:MAG: Dipeptide transport system permease protein DppC [uncultured Acidimicrobiales bacterium]
MADTLAPTLEPISLQLKVPRRAHGLVSFFRNRNNAIGAVILLPIVFTAVFASWLPIPDTLESDVTASLQGPSTRHFFGTDKLGRDIFARTVSGLRVSLMIGFASAFLSLTIGIIFGTIAGTLGKAADAAISAVVDVVMAFPALLLAISIIAVFGSGMPQLIIALGMASMPAAVRLQRSLALGLKSRTFMDGARMANAPTWWLLVRHVVPNTMAPMVVVATIYAANAILAEAALSFLGLGITPPTPSLGNLVADGRNYLREAWWISTIPGLAIVVVAISLHLFSDGIREQLDPSLRK